MLSAACIHFDIHSWFCFLSSVKESKNVLVFHFFFFSFRSNGWYANGMFLRIKNYKFIRNYLQTCDNSKREQCEQSKGNQSEQHTRIGTHSIIYKNKHLFRHEINVTTVWISTRSGGSVRCFKLVPSILFICFRFLFIFILFDLMAYACMGWVYAIISCFFFVFFLARKDFWQTGDTWQRTEDETHFYSAFIENKRIY